MPYFDISEDDVKSQDGKVAIITGSSSGIGLATVHLFLSKGATVVGADLHDPIESITSPNFAFHKIDVTSWNDLCGLFSAVHQTYGRIDVVFANAGIGPKANLLELQQDDEGKLVEPTKVTLQVNLISVVNQVSLAAHYMRQQEPKGGNIVLTASCVGYEKFHASDYVVAKHGVVGLLRAVSLHMNTPELPIRINAVAPSWTLSGMMRIPAEEFVDLGIESQPASAVAKSVGLLVSDETRHCHCLYSYGGRYVEMEGPVQSETMKAIGKKGLGEEDERVKLFARAAELRTRV